MFQMSKFINFTKKIDKKFALSISSTILLGIISCIIKYKLLCFCCMIPNIMLPNKRRQKTVVSLLTIVTWIFIYLSARNGKSFCQFLGFGNCQKNESILFDDYFLVAHLTNTPKQKGIRIYPQMRFDKDKFVHDITHLHSRERMIFLIYNHEPQYFYLLDDEVLHLQMADNDCLPFTIFKKLTEISKKISGFENYVYVAYYCGKDKEIRSIYDKLDTKSNSERYYALLKHFYDANDNRGMEVALYYSKNDSFINATIDYTIKIK